MKKNENIKIIKEAYLLIKDKYVFQKSTAYLQNSYWNALSEDDYNKLDYKLKAIRQDFVKILVIMNCIDRNYLSYKKGEYTSSYFSIADMQATNELGCFIEYLFAKYRVIFEYIQQIMEICIPNNLNDAQKEEYKKQKSSHKKYEFLLKYVDENIEKTNNILTTEWFQSIRIDRNFIIHEGATCLVFGDKENLLFKVMTTDALDKEEGEIDPFYSNENGLIYYDRFWGLYISRLIVFSETIFSFLKNTATIKEERKKLLEQCLKERNKFVDNYGTKLDDIQDVLCRLLKILIDTENVY